MHGVVHRVVRGVVLRVGVSVFNPSKFDDRQPSYLWLKYDKTSKRFNHLGL